MANIEEIGYTKRKLDLQFESCPPPIGARTLGALVRVGLGMKDEMRGNYRGNCKTKGNERRMESDMSQKGAAPYPWAGSVAYRRPRNSRATGAPNDVPSHRLCMDAWRPTWHLAILTAGTLVEIGTSGMRS